MDINYLELASGWMLNCIDFMMLYIVTNSLLGYRSNEAFKRISLRMASFALVYGLVMGIFGYFVDLGIYHVVIITSMLGVIHIIVKKIAKISFTDKVLILIIYYISIHIMIMPIFLIVTRFNIGEMLEGLLIYTFFISILFLLCLKIDFNKFFVFVSRKVLFRIMFFSLMVVFIALYATFSFNTDYMLESGVFFIVFMTIAVNCLYLTLKNAYEYMEVMPDIYHDTKKLLIILNSKFDDINDVDEMKEAYRKIMDMMELDITPEVNLNNKNEFEGFILKTVQSIKMNKNSSIPIEVNIDFYELHPVIDDLVVSYMLGILLENAIETMTNKPVFVDIISSERAVMIKVMNEAKYKSKEEMEAMLVKNYSTKKQVGRGFGLAKLKKLVEKKKGKISIFQEFNHKEQVNYLSILIKF